jgi:WD40 repeat protein
VQEWNVLNQTVIRSLVRATGQISGTAFTPDSSKVVASSYDGTVSVYDVNSGQRLRQVIPGGNAFALAASAEIIAAAINTPNVVQLYRLSDGTLVRTLVPSGSLPYTYSAAFSPDGAILATGHFNDTVQVWNVSDGTLIRTLTGQSGAMNGVTYSSNGSFLVAASAGGYVHVWDPSGNLVRTLGPVGQALTSVAVSADNQFILAGGDGGLVQLWRLDNGAFVYSFTETGRITAVRFAPTGYAFYVGRSTPTFTVSGTIQIYRTADHLLLETYNLETGGFGNNPSGPLAMAVSPDGKRLSYGRDDATLVMSYNTRISAPISATLFMGQLVSGSFQDLVLPDGAALVARPGFNGDRQSAPVQLDIVAHSTLPNLLRLSFQIVAVANSGGLQQEIWMKNGQTGTFELVDTRPAATTDQAVRIELGPNVMRYIDGSGNMTARVKWFSSPTASRTWQVSVDQAIWAAGL